MTDLIKDFEKEFEKIRKEIGFKPTLEQLDEVFYIRDFINKETYVSTAVLKQVCRRIVDVYSVWLQYMHGLISPNPGNMINMTEAQLYSDDERNKINKLIDRIMILSNNYNLLVINKEKKQGKDFVDEAYSFWETELKDELNKLMIKARDNWKDKLNSKPEKKKRNEADNMFG